MIKSNFNWLLQSKIYVQIQIVMTKLIKWIQFQLTCSKSIRFLSKIDWNWLKKIVNKYNPSTFQLISSFLIKINIFKIFLLHFKSSFWSFNLLFNLWIDFLIKNGWCHKLCLRWSNLQGNSWKTFEQKKFKTYTDLEICWLFFDTLKWLFYYNSKHNDTKVFFSFLWMLAPLWTTSFIEIYNTKKNSDGSMESVAQWLA